MPPARHPGRILIEDYLHPLHVSQNALARMMGVHPRVVNRICKGQRPITAPIAILLGAVLCMRAHFWLQLQANYDICRLEGEVLSTLPNRAEDTVEIDL